MSSTVWLDVGLQDLTLPGEHDPAWGALKTLPEAIRDKKEFPLELNLAEIMESLGDALTKQAFAASQLREPSALTGPEQQ